MLNNSADPRRWSLHCQIEDSSFQWQLFEQETLGLTSSIHYVNTRRMEQKIGLLSACFGLLTRLWCKCVQKRIETIVKGCMAYL